MKNIISLLTLSIICVHMILAQTQKDTGKTRTRSNENEIRTIFNNPAGPLKVGFFVGPEFAYSQFKEKPVFLAGLSAGVILNHNFSVGFSGYGIMNSQDLYYKDIKDTTGGYLYGGYGGLRLELIANPKSPVHLSFPLLIGGGGLNYSSYNYFNNNGNQSNMHNDDYTIATAAFFVLQPGVMVGFNLLRFMRFDTGISYRYTPNFEMTNTSGNLINNFNASASLKFGKF